MCPVAPTRPCTHAHTHLADIEGGRVHLLERHRPVRRSSRSPDSSGISQTAMWATHARRECPSLQPSKLWQESNTTTKRAALHLSSICSHRAHTHTRASPATPPARVPAVMPTTLPPFPPRPPAPCPRGPMSVGRSQVQVVDVLWRGRVGAVAGPPPRRKARRKREQMPLAAWHFWRHTYSKSLVCGARYTGKHFHPSTAVAAPSPSNTSCSHERGSRMHRRATHACQPVLRLPLASGNGHNSPHPPAPTSNSHSPMPTS